ncbi:hypothetical protein PVAP13_2NG405100 [Panicum virgatum]|uniref:Uncharacterized protein n=1 Tax=Panicum virgatum TaxID=38727 RepID=A0A8T0VI17_PANVG|nr:hypothetical protein PVAP13_2NG405100 [Panicum virgatum]
MGSCVSRSTAVSSAAAESVCALTAKVVGLDGSLAQFAAPVTAHDALAAVVAGWTSARPSARDALQPGQLYFALPVAMLGRPLPAQDMAALAARASAALGTAPAVAVATAGVGCAAAGAPSLLRSKAGAASNKRRRRVAPLLVVSAHADGEWKSDHARGGSYGGAAKAAESGDRTVGKARWGVGPTHRGVVARRAAAVQRLSAIAEAASE